MYTTIITIRFNFKDIKGYVGVFETFASGIHEDGTIVYNWAFHDEYKEVQVENEVNKVIDHVYKCEYERDEYDENMNHIKEVRKSILHC